MSIFYAALFERPFPVSLLAFERLSALGELHPRDAVLKVLTECCNVYRPTEQDIEYLQRRVEAAAQEVEKKARVPDDDDDDRPRGKSLGTSFQTFTRTLDAARILLWACGFDYEKAKFWFTEADRDDAMQVVDDFLRLQQERNAYLYEAALYGFGGKYRDDGNSSGDGEEIDLTGASAAQIMGMMRS